MSSQANQFPMNLVPVQTQNGSDIRPPSAQEMLFIQQMISRKQNNPNTMLLLSPMLTVGAQQQFQYQADQHKIPILRQPQAPPLNGQFLGMGATVDPGNQQNWCFNNVNQGYFLSNMPVESNQVPSTSGLAEHLLNLSQEKQDEISLGPISALEQHSVGAKSSNSSPSDNVANNAEPRTQNSQLDSATGTDNLRNLVNASVNDGTIKCEENLVLAMALTLYGFPNDATSPFSTSNADIIQYLSRNQQLREKIFDARTTSAMFSTSMKPGIKKGGSNLFGGVLHPVPYLKPPAREPRSMPSPPEESARAKKQKTTV